MEKQSAKFFRQPSKPGSVLFTNAVILDVEKSRQVNGNVLVIDGVIKSVGKINDSDRPADIEIIDCKGKILAPGIVDAQVHIGEPGGSYKENIMQVTKAAVAGGVTTINVMPDTKPAIDSTAMVEYIKTRSAEKAYCNITLFGSITKNLEGKELCEMGLMKKAGVAGFSQGPEHISDSLVFKRALEYASDFNMMVAQQPQDCYLSEGGAINDGAVSTRLGVNGIPSIAEKIGLERDIAIAELTGAKYHALNITSALSIEPLKTAKKKKLNVTASATVNHIALTEDEAENYRTFAKINPPLRTEDDRRAVIHAIKDGVIDFITSNHSPRSVDQKRLPLSSAEFGVVGLETLLAACVTHLVPAGFSISEIFRYLSLNPAQFLGIKKGLIREGFVADLIIIDIDTSWTVDPEKFSGKAVNSPFDGKTLKGRVLQTFIAGEKVYENEKSD